MEDISVKLQDWAAIYGINLIVALLILLVGRWVARWIQGITERIMTARQMEGTLISFVSNLAYMAMMTFVILTALGKLGISTNSFVAVIGAAGLAIALAFQNSLSNFAAGFLLILFKPFKQGDYIEGGGTAGVVQHIQIFTTTLLTPDNKVIIIPNGKMMGDNITNYSAKQTRRVDLKFGVSYTDDLQKVKAVLQRIVESDARILKDPAHTIAVSELADSSVNLVVRVWVKTADYWNVYFAMTETVKTTFDAEGISIPFPQRDIHLHQKN